MSDVVSQVKKQITFTILLDETNNIFQISSKEMNCSFPVKATEEQLKKNLTALINEWVDSGFGEYAC